MGLEAGCCCCFSRLVVYPGETGDVEWHVSARTVGKECGEREGLLESREARKGKKKVVHEVGALVLRYQDWPGAADPFPHYS